ncbi:MAG: hypothetical protein H0U57_04590 [Tatlockia sp.]|nr:hypothetical protein [Tatlockia sp.]
MILKLSPAILELTGPDAPDIDYDLLIGLFEQLKENLPIDDWKLPEPEDNYFQYYSVSPAGINFVL